MKKNTIIVLLLILFNAGQSFQLLSQTPKETRIAIDHFTPFYDDVKNDIFEESFLHMFRLGLIFQKNIEIVTIDPNSYGVQKKYNEEKTQAQQVYKNNNQILKDQADVIIYGDYSITPKELFIVPKLYDVKNDKNYTLPSLTISDLNKGLELSKFENLLSDYNKKIRSVINTNLGLKKVGLVWAKKPDQKLSSYEESLYRNYVINTTKSADTVGIVNVLSWDKLEPFYYKNEGFEKAADAVKADILYVMYFEPVTDFESKVSVELYFNKKKSKKKYFIQSFQINLLEDINENYFISDFYNLFDDLKRDSIIDPGILDFQVNTKQKFMEKGLSYFNEQKYFLSNLMFYNALELSDNVDDKAYCNYMNGTNFEYLNQNYRAFSHFEKSLEADSSFKQSWAAIAPYYFDYEDYTGAADALLRVEQIDPNYYTEIIHYYIGYSYDIDAQYEMALSYYKNAFEEYNKKIESGDIYGESYNNIPDPEYITYSIDLIGEEAYYSIIDMYEIMGDYGGADYYFSQFDETVQSDYSDNISIAEYYYQEGESALYNYQFEKADEYLDKVDSIYQYNQDDSDYLYSVVGNYNYLRKVASLYLNNYEKAYNITVNGIESGEFDINDVYLQNAIELTYVESIDTSERYLEIIRYYKLHTEANPNDSLNAQYLNSIGYYYTLLDDINSGVQYFEKALELNPNNLSAQLNMMEVYLVYNKYEKVYATAEVIQNSLDMYSKLESNSGRFTIFNFLLINAKLVNDKDYTNENEQFFASMNKEDFSTGWNFSIYEVWLDNLNDAGDQKKIRKMYEMLTKRIEDLQY